MSDLVTLPRAVVRQALEALENSSPDQYPEDAGVFYDAKDALRAALEQPARPLCKGIPRRGCNYLAPCDTVCNKCGEIHHHHQMVAQFEAAKQPEQEPVAWANINKHGDITHTSNKQMRWARTALYTHPPRRA